MDIGWATVELIVLEAAHRLHFDCGIELERIDNANVLSFALLGDSGLIHGASQRYFDIRAREGSSRMTLLSGIYSSGRVPRAPLPFPCLDHQSPMRWIYGGGWIACLVISAQASAVSISIALYTTVGARVRIPQPKTNQEFS